MFVLVRGNKIDWANFIIKLSYCWDSRKLISFIIKAIYVKNDFMHDSLEE